MQQRENGILEKKDWKKTRDDHFEPGVILICNLS